MMLSEMPMYYAGGGFPWGLLIIGGILYFVWRSGMFGGPGRHGNGQRFGGYGSGYGPGQATQDPGFGQAGEAGFRSPREVFDDWHRQAHETPGTRPQAQSPAASPTAAMQPTAAQVEAPASGDGEHPR